MLLGLHPKSDIVTPSDIFHNPAALIMNLGHLNSGPGGSYGQGAGNPPSPPPPGGNGNGNGTYDAFPYPENKTKGKGKARGREREEDDDLEDDDLGAYSYPEGAGESDNGEYTALTTQTLNPDGTPKRPMNAFLLYAKKRRPEISTENPSMRTGEISKILSKEWSTMDKQSKSFYQDQAKKLKDRFNARWPEYVYRRRPNNSRKRRKAAPSEHATEGDISNLSRGASGSGGSVENGHISGGIADSSEHDGDARRFTHDSQASQQRLPAGGVPPGFGHHPSIGDTNSLLNRTPSGGFPPPNAPGAPGYGGPYDSPVDYPPYPSLYNQPNPPGGGNGAYSHSRSQNSRFPPSSTWPGGGSGYDNPVQTSGGRGSSTVSPATGSTSTPAGPPFPGEHEGSRQPGTSSSSSGTGSGAGGMWSDIGSAGRGDTSQWGPTLPQPGRRHGQPQLSSIVTSISSISPAPQDAHPAGSAGSTPDLQLPGVLGSSGQRPPQGQRSRQYSGGNSAVSTPIQHAPTPTPPAANYPFQTLNAPLFHPPNTGDPQNSSHHNQSPYFASFPSSGQYTPGGGSSIGRGMHNQPQQSPRHSNPHSYHTSPSDPTSAGVARPSPPSPTTPDYTSSQHGLHQPLHTIPIPLGHRGHSSEPRSHAGGGVGQVRGTGDISGSRGEYAPPSHAQQPHHSNQHNPHSHHTQHGYWDTVKSDPGG